jgi:hypothetical protein
MDDPPQVRNIGDSCVLLERGRGVAKTPQARGEPRASACCLCVSVVFGRYQLALKTGAAGTAPLARTGQAPLA